MTGDRREAVAFQNASHADDCETMVCLAMEGTSDTVRRWASMWLKERRGVTVVIDEPALNRAVNGA